VPVATPVEKYAHPAQPPIDHNWESLINGLSTLNSALDGYKSAEARKKKEPEVVDKDAIQAQYGTKSSTEMAQALAQGQVAGGPKTLDYLGQLRGAKQGDEDGAFLSNFYNTQFDKTNGNIGKEVDDYVAKRVATEYANNKYGADAYMQRMTGVRENLIQQQLAFQKDAAHYEVSQAAQDGTTSILRQAVEAGYTPQQTIDEVARNFNNNKAFLNFSYKEQAKAFIQSAQPLLTDMQQNPQKADAYYDKIQAVLEGGRKDPKDGVTRRMVDLPDGIGDMAKQTLTQFKEQRDKIVRGQLDNQIASIKYNADKHPELVDMANLEQLHTSKAISGPEYESILQSRAKALDTARDSAAEYAAKSAADQAVTTQTAADYKRAQELDFFQPGETKVPGKNAILGKDPNDYQTLTQDARQQAVVNSFTKDQDYERQKRINGGEDPAAVNQDLNGKAITFYSKNGLAPKKWGDDAKAAVNMLTTSIDQGNGVPPQAKDALAQYKMLDSQGRQLIPQVYDERSKNILSMAAVIPGDPDAALQMAVKAYGKRDEKRDAIVAKDVQEQIKNTGYSWSQSFKHTLTLGYAQGRIDNMGIMQDRVQKRAEAYMRGADMTADDAVKQAAADTEKDFVPINNKLVDISNKRLPENPQQLLQDYIHHVAKTVGPEKFGADSEDDMTYADGPNGVLQIVSKKHGMSLGDRTVPIQDRNGNTYNARYLTPDILHILSADQRTRDVNRAVKTGEDRLQPLFVLPGTSVGIGRPHAPWNTLSKEEQAKEQQNFDKAGQVKGDNKKWMQQFKTNADNANVENDKVFSGVRAATPRNPFKPNQ
jgi:hypothetical protein